MKNYWKTAWKNDHRLSFENMSMLRTNPREETNIMKHFIYIIKDFMMF